MFHICLSSGECCWVPMWGFNHHHPTWWENTVQQTAQLLPDPIQRTKSASIMTGTRSSSVTAELRDREELPGSGDKGQSSQPQWDLWRGTFSFQKPYGHDVWQAFSGTTCSILLSVTCCGAHIMYSGHNAFLQTWCLEHNGEEAREKGSGSRAH